MSFPFADVEKAINGLRAKLQRTPVPLLQEQFNAGLRPNLLAYQKPKATDISIPILDRYLIGAASYLHQPSNYYDIFGAGRCVILVQLLDSALRVLTRKKVRHLSQRLERLARAADFDTFDSVAFELFTAGKYAAKRTVRGLEFIEEQPPQKTPDFSFRFRRSDSFVECKKVARVKDFSFTTRSNVRELLNNVIAAFRERNVSVLAEVVFNGDPNGIKAPNLLNACEAALSDRTTIVSGDFTVTARPLSKYKSKDYALYPSPRFSWLRYGHRVRSEWFGIVHQVIGNRVRLANLPAHLQGGISTWLDTVDWDAAIKWKISAPAVVAKYRRFGFDGLFEAIGQLNNSGSDSTVHLWLESDHYIRGRRDALLDFFRRLSLNEKRKVGWIVINETLLDISPKGRFDLIEHAHMIHGPTATTPHPPVSGVFGIPVPLRGIAEFGVGHDLPDIDED